MSGNPDLVSFGIEPDHLQWWHRYPGYEWSHSVMFKQLDEGTNYQCVSPKIIHRLLCHFLIDRIPDEGLPELVESVGGIYEFYQLPAPTPALLPQHRSVSGEISRSYERPPFQIEEEE